MFECVTMLTGLEWPSVRDEILLKLLSNAGIPEKVAKWIIMMQPCSMYNLKHALWQELRVQTNVEIPDKGGSSK